MLGCTTQTVLNCAIGHIHHYPPYPPQPASFSSPASNPSSSKFPLKIHVPSKCNMRLHKSQQSPGISTATQVIGNSCCCNPCSASLSVLSVLFLFLFWDVASARLPHCALKPRGKSCLHQPQNLGGGFRILLLFLDIAWDMQPSWYHLTFCFCC